MHDGYSYQVAPQHFDHIASVYEANGKRLDESMRSDYNMHLIVGRNGCNELLFVLHDHSNSDGCQALFEACGVYCCKVGHFPDFFVARGEVLMLTVTGAAGPQCLNFTKLRRMFMLLGHNLDAFDSMLSSCRSHNFDALGDVLPSARTDPHLHQRSSPGKSPSARQGPAPHAPDYDGERQSFVHAGVPVEIQDPG